jgi:hypothetical protein
VSKSVVKGSWMKCSEVCINFSNRVANIITRYIHHIKFAACMAFSFFVFVHR